MLKELNEKEEKRLEEYLDMWTEYAFDCNPSNREMAMEGVAEIYKAQGHKMPKKVYWVDNVLAGAELVAKLLNEDPANKTKQTAKDVLSHVNYGQHEASWLAFYEALGEFGEDVKNLEGLFKIGKSTGWWWSLDEAVVMCERFKTIGRDNRGRLHSTTGKALEFRDGTGYYIVHGIDVEPKVIEAPHTLTVEEIRNQNNIEVRRVMLDLYGIDKFLKNSKAKQKHSDQYGILWETEIPNDEALVMVQLKNSTPEGLWHRASGPNEVGIEDTFGRDLSHKTPQNFLNCVLDNKGMKFIAETDEKGDLIFKDYFLRVPPATKTAKAGVAWSFEMTEDEYAPLMET